MSRLDKALHNDIKALELLRDELKLHAHLLKAEAKTRWNELESKWDVLKEHLGRAQVAAGASKQELDSAITLLVDALKVGYKDIKNALKS